MEVKESEFAVTCNYVFGVPCSGRRHMFWVRIGVISLMLDFLHRSRGISGSESVSMQ